MADIVRLTRGHPLVGTWRASDEEYGTTVRFTISGAAAGFNVWGTDTSDGEELAISGVDWDGRVLRFVSVVPSNGHRVEYAIEVASPGQATVRYTCSEQWLRAE
jgi:hypothetical protein